MKELKELTGKALEEFLEDAERYTEPSEEAIDEYNRKWYEKRMKKKPCNSNTKTLKS